MDARLDRIVFGGQAERVKAHRLEDIIALHAQVARVGISQAEVIPMPDMQLGARGVGEHFKHIFFGLVAVTIEMVQSGLLPDFLPFLFNFW